MLKKPQGYDEAAAYTGESQRLPRGKYICIIKQVTQKESSNGSQQFIILFDIADGDQKDFYQKLFDTDKAKNPSEAKWKGIFKQNMEGKGTPWLKGVITSLERSNNFIFRWDKENNEKDLVGKKFGGLFIRRQFEADNGDRPIVTELRQIRSVAGLAEAELLEDEMLPDVEKGGSRPEPASAAAPPPFTDSDGFTSIPEGTGNEGIPFM